MEYQEMRVVSDEHGTHCYISMNGAWKHQRFDHSKSLGDIVAGLAFAPPSQWEEKDPDAHEEEHHEEEHHDDPPPVEEDDANKE